MIHTHCHNTDLHKNSQVILRWVWEALFTPKFCEDSRNLFPPQSKIHLATFTPQHNKLTLVYYGSLWQYWWQALSIDSFCMRFNMPVKTKAKTTFPCWHVQTRQRAHAPSHICFLNDYGDWCRTPWLINPSHITLKPPAETGSCTSLTSRCFRTHILQTLSSGLHANLTVWRLVILSWCGVGLWYINEHSGSALLAPQAVLGRPSMVNSDPLPHLRPLSWDFVGQMPGSPGHTKRLLTHMEARRSLVEPFITQLSEGPFFQHSLLLLISSFFKSERCVCFTASVSSVLPPLTQGQRSPCSKMGWVQSSKIPPQFLIYSPRQPLFISHFLAHEVCSLYGHFLHELCHTHRSNLLIGAIKR